MVVISFRKLTDVNIIGKIFLSKKHGLISFKLLEVFRHFMTLKSYTETSSVPICS